MKFAVRSSQFAVRMALLALVAIFHLPSSIFGQTPLTADGLATFGTNATSGGGGCTPAYAPPYGTGDRTAGAPVLTAHSVVGTLYNIDPPSFLVDGNTSSDAGKGNFEVRNLGVPGGTEWLQADFLTAVLVTEVTYIQGAAQDQGTWQFQGSTDASSWTDLGGTVNITLATQVITTMSANVTSYRYYRMLGISGLTSGAVNGWQINFKTCPHS